MTGRAASPPPDQPPSPRAATTSSSGESSTSSKDEAESSSSSSSSSAVPANTNSSGDSAANNTATDGAASDPAPVEAAAPVAVPEQQQQQQQQQQNNEELNKTANHVYIHHPEHSWIPAQVVERPSPTSAVVSIPKYAGEQAIVCDGGRTARQWEQATINLETYPNKALPLQNVNPEGSLQVVEDMVDLPFLHEVRRTYY
jgi:hypothetical protein